MLALQALLACPTASIRTEKAPKDISQAQATIPIRVPLPDTSGETASADEEEREEEGAVYHLAYHSESSYGATSYLIRLPRRRSDGSAGGVFNVMVDSPRWSVPLAKELDGLGGVHAIFLTHQDDVADHDRWAARFGAPRVVHLDDIGPRTREVEIKLAGAGPWILRRDGDERISVDIFGKTEEGKGEDQDEHELTLIHTPGHTAGCVSLLWRRRRTPGWGRPAGVLFTGDHLAKNRHEGMARLTAFRGYCWGDWQQQRESVEKLLGLDFTVVLPGHGRRDYFPGGVEEKDAALLELLEKEW